MSEQHQELNRIDKVDNGVLIISDDETNAHLLHPETFPSKDEVIEGSNLGTSFDYEKSNLHSPIISPQICNENVWNRAEGPNEKWKRDETEIKNGKEDESEDGYEVSVCDDDDDIEKEKWKIDAREEMDNGAKNENGNAHDILAPDNLDMQNENQKRNRSEQEMKNENETNKKNNTFKMTNSSITDQEEFVGDAEEKERDEHLSREVESLSSNKQLHNMQTREQTPKTRKHKKNEDSDISERYLCHVCGKTYSQLSHLFRHTKSAHTKESFLQCTICDTTFTRAESLIRHLKLHEQRQGASASKGPFKCPLCCKTYQQQYNVSRHLLSHYDLKPFQCPECYKTFTQHTGLSRHLIIHKGSREFKCDVCGKAFARQFVLSRHKLTHTEDKPYKCFMCSKSFIRGSQLQCHMKSHKRMAGNEDVKVK